MKTLAKQALEKFAALTDDPIPYGEPGHNWGSPLVFREQQIIASLGGKPDRELGGYLFPDLSHIIYKQWGVWEAHSPKWVAEQRNKTMENDIGLSQHVEIEIGADQPALIDVLQRLDIPYETFKLENIVGMGGAAYLLWYTSRKTGKPVTVLCIPLQWDVDSFGEEYFYFEGLTKEEALQRDWIKVYDKAKLLTTTGKTMTIWKTNADARE